MTPEQLAAIRARAEAATPGPWHDDQDGMVYSTCQPGCAVVINDIDLAVEDAEFIAHAREDIPALVAEVERLQTELARMRPVVEAAQRWHVAAQHYDAAMRSRDYGAADLADAELNAATERLIAAVAALDAAREEPR